MIGYYADLPLYSMIFSMGKKGGAIVTGFLKWALRGFLSFLGILFTFVVIKVIRDRLVASITGSVLDSVVDFMAWPFKAIVQMIPDHSATPPPGDFPKWTFFGLSFFVEIVWLAGLSSILVFIYFLIYKGFKGYYPFTDNRIKWIASSEMAAAVAAVDERPGSDSALEAVDTFLDAFNSGVASLLNLKEHEFRSYWLVKTNNDREYTSVSTSQHLNENDIHIIEAALRHPGKKTFADRPNIVPGKYENYPVDYVLFQRNSWNFRLADSVFVMKKDAITIKQQEAFFTATANLLYLGHVDKFPETVLKLNRT